ncbi:MAG: ClpX C4-type zinc finger protein [Methylovirgula sp.]
MFRKSCGRSEREVCELVSGSKAYICDARISVCNGILEAAPKTLASLDAMTDEQLLRR